MPRRTIVVGAVAGSFRYGRMWLVQMIANPLIALLFALWLLIPVANKWNVVVNAFVALVIAVSIIVLHAGTLNYFRDRCDKSQDAAPLKSAFIRALRHVLAIAVCVAVFYLLWRLMDRVDAYSDSLPAYFRSTMSASIRRHIALSFLKSAYAWISFTLSWLAIPGLILPLALAAADLGFRGFWRAGFAMWRNAVSHFSYWCILAVAVLAGVLAAPAIMAWTQDFSATASALRFESASLVLRVIVAYALGLWAWMLACSVVALASLGRDDGAVR